MESWLGDFWSHLHTAEGLRHLIIAGGIGIMCLIVFAETGLLAGFFLPGDSLLVTAGVLSATSGDRTALFNPWAVAVALSAAAIIGNQTGYWLGHKFGRRTESRPDSWFFKRRHLNAAREYFAAKGPLALVLARFIPIFRTFVPFAAGMGSMSSRGFLRWNIIGGLLWVNSLVWLGYFIGGTPLADELHKVILIVVAVSFVPVLWGLTKKAVTSGWGSRIGR